MDTGNTTLIQPDYANQNQPQREEVTDNTPSLYLPIEDSELVSLIERKEKNIIDFNNDKLKLKQRQKKNRDFWRGEQYEDEANFESWQIAYKDNVIYQDLETRITLAASRMPDIIVTPPNDNDASITATEIYERILNIKLNSALTQRILKRGLRNHHLDFFAVIKARWDPNLASGSGDFIFELVRPERILLDHTATIPDNGYTADNLEFTIEYLEEPLGVVLAKFPNKASELLKLVSNDKKTDISKLKYTESWFTYYTPEGEIYEGVCWKFQKIILDKKRCPYYDWTGYEVTQPGTKADGSYKSNPTKSTKYYNYFERPRKPYIILSYQNLDMSPIDDTSPVEQAIPIQKLVNRLGRQITEISDNAVPKRIFAGKYIQKEEARRVSSDPDEAIWLDGADNVNNAFMVTTAQPPSPVLLSLQQSARQRIDALFATHSTIRGEDPATQQSGVAKQISREGDLMMSDDLVDIVVERTILEMAGWATQFMKMFYDQPHYVRQVGQDGDILFKEFSRDDIQDGIMVDVKANAVDKITARSDAVNLASRKAVDPYTMFKDMGLNNPKERTRYLLSFLNGANDGYASYMAEIKLEYEHQNQAPPGVQGGDNASASQAEKDIESLVEGNQISPPDHFDQSYVDKFIAFTHSGQFDQLDPQIKQNITQFVQQLEENFQNFSVNTPNGVAGGQPMQGQPPIQAPQTAMSTHSTTPALASPGG